MAVLGLGILVLFLSQTIATLLREWLLVYLRARIDIHMMLGFVEHLLTLPYSFFQQRSSGDLLTRLASNTLLRDMLSNELLSALLDSSLVIFYLVILLWQSLPFGLLTLVIGLLQVLLLLGSTRPIRNLASRELAAVTEAEPEQQGQAAQVPPALTGHIRLEHVSFRYAPDAPEVLHQLELTVEAGQKVAIVGPSGAGKSTLGKLFLGLYMPTEGS